jgi:tRNA pseudouridine38-40 synthase
LTLFDPPDADEGAVTRGDDDRAGRSSEATVSVRLRLVVAYDGAGFRGFAAQPGQRTVAGELGGALSTALRQPVDITCAGRTDAGVHAAGQVIHVDVAGPVDVVSLVRAVNALVGPAIVVRTADTAPPGFDARTLSSPLWRGTSATPWT